MAKTKKIPKFQRQKSFHDHYIRCEKDFEYHINYAIYPAQSPLSTKSKKPLFLGRRYAGFTIIKNTAFLTIGRILP